MNYPGADIDLINVLKLINISCSTINENGL